MPPNNSAKAESHGHTWDGSPQTKYDWFESLPDILDAKTSASFRTMWQSGYAVERTKVVVSSEAQAAHLILGNLVKRPFDNPTEPASFHPIDATKDIKAVVVDPSRYVVAPEILEAKDRDLFAAIAETIENRKRTQDYEKKSKGSGLRLIRILAEEIDTASAEISQWAARRLADIVAAGIQSPTTVGFDDFRQQYESTNKRMTATRRNPDSVIADTYAAAVRQLGDNIGTRLDMELTLAKHAKLAAGHTKVKTLTLEETVACIHEILSDSELRNTGQAFKGREVKPPKSPPLTWTEGKHDLCSICNGKHGGGRHLRRDCPDKAADPIKKVKLNVPRDPKPSKGAIKIASSHNESLENHTLDWTSDVALSKLFADDEPPSTLYPTIPDDTAAEATGSALAIKGQTSGNATPPTRTEGALMQSPVQPSPLSPEQVRQLVEKLSPASPMKEFGEVKAKADLPVSLRTGGPDKRSRIDILGEMRAEVGLDPFVVPVGKRVGPLVKLPPQHRKMKDDSSDSESETMVSTNSHSDSPIPRTSSLTQPTSISNPLELIGTPGAPTLTKYSVSTDDLGRVCHTYHFSTSPPRSWVLTDGNNSLKERPPPRATLLGKSADSSVKYWGAEDGSLVACPSQKSPSQSTPMGSPPARATPTPRERRQVRSPLRDVALAVVALASAIVAMSVANSPSTQEHPFEPGSFRAFEHLVSHHRDVHPPLALAYILGLMLMLAVRQANTGGGWAATKTSGPTTPRRLAQWAPLYHEDRSQAWKSLATRPRRWRDVPQLLPQTCEFAALCLLCALAGRLGLRLSIRANSRRMLPSGSDKLPSRGASLRLVALVLVSGIASLLFCWGPTCFTCLACVTASISRRTSNIDSNPVESPLKAHWSQTRESIPRDSSRGRALKSSTRTTAQPSLTPPTGWSTSRPIRRWVDLVIDSGCTWHTHNRLDELINIRSCDDSVEDASGKRVRCTHMGDLPTIIRSDAGVELRFLLRDVRWAPSFTDSLLSVDQLWEYAKADCVFRDQRSIVFTLNHDGRSSPLCCPFRKIDGLYRWTVGIARVELNTTSGSSRQLKGGIHSPKSHSHLDSLPADQLAAILHRRLHIGADRLRELGKLAGDVPTRITGASIRACTKCAEANSTRQSHSRSLYEPSHAGKLIHADIAGPFKPSEHGGFRYCLLLVDDHSRFKFVYFLHKRSDAKVKIDRFISEFNALASLHADTPIRGVGKIRTDGAGEFISKEFAELLDQHHIHHVTSPPHVHQLNGVAERAIRSAFSLVRSYLTSSGVSTGHWPHAVEMAVDVLNRTTGPLSSKGGRTSYEILTGRRPKLMSIMPFGCRAFAVKPEGQFSKTTIDPRAWVGINLGKSRASPQAFKIYCPSTGRTVVTSDAYFMEHVYPCRAKGFQVDDEVLAVPTRVIIEPEDAEEDGRALASGSTRLHQLPNRVLLLFSGSYSRPDGLAAMLRRKGVEVDEVDSDPSNGNPSHDLLNDDFFLNQLDRAKRGDYSCIFAAPPCSTYSVARFFSPKRGKAGAPPVRSREHILGLPRLPPGHEVEVRRANELTRRTCAILRAAQGVGADFVIENPADRGDASLPHLFQFAEHGPIWLDPHMLTLRRACTPSSVTFAQCMVGGASQKYTTLWYTAGLSSLDSLRGMWCHHPPGAHEMPAGGDYDDETKCWNSARAAAYPTDLNALFADAIVDAIVTGRIFQREEHPADTNLPPSTDRPIIESTSPMPTPPADESPPTEPPAPVRDEIPQEPISEDVQVNTPHSPAVESNTPEVKPKRKHERRTVPLRALGPFPTRQSFAKVAAAHDDDPTTHAEAMRLDADGWGGAEATEIDNHEGNRSWEYIPQDQLPKGRRTVKLTWVFKTKRGPERKKKARLCVQGCSQIHGEDYDQTFCAALRAGSLRTLCAIAAKLSLEMYRWDFVAAYLQGELEPGEVVYCTPPAGFSTAEIEGKVKLVPRDKGDGVRRLCKVVRPVYGMAQAGRRWQRTLFPWLLSWENGGAKLSQSNYDPCVFHCSQEVRVGKETRTERLFVGCYVDDLFILASHTDEGSIYQRFTADLATRWNVEDEGPVSDLLSIEIDRVDSQVRLKQTRHIEKMLDKYAPDGIPNTEFASHKLSSQPPSKPPCGTDLPQLVADALTQDAKHVDQSLLKAYQSITGALLYCAVNTRPDVAYAVGMLCRAMGKPTVPLLNAAYRVLYYLYHQRHVGLHYSACELDLSGMSDADWAVRHSTSGFVFTYNQAAISWSSKKQPCVALSSCEAEIVALSEAAKEGVYLSNFLDDLGLSSGDPTSLATDNSAARDLKRTIPSITSAPSTSSDDIFSSGTWWRAIAWWCLTCPLSITWLTSSPNLWKRLVSIACETQS